MKNELSTYQLQGNPIVEVPVPRIGNLIYDDLGKLVLAQLNEEFRGNNKIAFTEQLQKNQPLPFSNTPRVLFIDHLLRKELGNTHVLSPIEVVKYWDAVPEKLTTYADTNAITLYPKKGPHEGLKQEVLHLLGRETIDHPLLVMGLGVKKADNKYGFTYTETPYGEVIDAPFLTRDQRVTYDPHTQTLIPGKDERSVPIWTPGGQSGLRRASRDWNDELSFRVDDLLNSKFSLGKRDFER